MCLKISLSVCTKDNGKENKKANKNPDKKCTYERTYSLGKTIDGATTEELPSAP